MSRSIRSSFVVLIVLVLSFSVIPFISGCSQPSNEPKFDENITKEDLSEALGVGVDDKIEAEPISQGDHNYLLSADELDGKAAKTIEIDDEDAFKEFTKDVEAGEYDDKVVSIEGYSAAFTHRHYISVQNAGEGDMNVIMPESYVGIPYEINGTSDGDYPANAQQIKITGKVMQNPAAPKVRVLITLPKYVEDMSAASDE